METERPQSSFSQPYHILKKLKKLYIYIKDTHVYISKLFSVLRHADVWYQFFVTVLNFHKTGTVKGNLH